MRLTFADSLLASLALACVLIIPGNASAATMACNGNCTWSVSVDNQEELSGTYVIADDGSLHVTPSDTLSATFADGSSVSLNNFFGNADPIIGFSLGAGTGATGKTFAFNFSLPISLSGSINANSSVSYSLTSLTGAGAQITPLFGKLVVAQEVDTTVGGLAPLNKGVDVGNTFAVLGGPLTGNSPVYTAAHTFVGSTAYDLMSVTIAFSLSPNSNVGVSGFVQQEPAPVPLPAALPLLLSGLTGLIGFVRRRSISLT